MDVGCRNDEGCQTAVTGYGRDARIEMLNDDGWCEAVNHVASLVLVSCDTVQL